MNFLVTMEHEAERIVRPFLTIPGTDIRDDLPFIQLHILSSVGFAVEIAQGSALSGLWTRGGCTILRTK